MSDICEFVHVFVFTTNHHLKEQNFYLDDYSKRVCDPNCDVTST